jgi:aspartate racemase
MSQHIGIVACSAEGAALCYRTFCIEGAQLLGPHDHPEVSLHTYSLAQYMRPIRRNDWPAVADLMLSSANKLATIGADFLICPDNTIHQALPLLADRSPLPWLHIAEVVANHAAARGFHRVALTGTRWLVESNVYPDKLAARNIETVRPDAIERETINRIIMDELVYGIFKPESIAAFQSIITRLHRNPPHPQRRQLSPAHAGLHPPPGQSRPPPRRPTRLIYTRSSTPRRSRNRSPRHTTSSLA